jgi:hypothetical protein
VEHLYADKQQASTVGDRMFQSGMLLYDVGHVVVCEGLHVGRESKDSNGHCKVSTGPLQHFLHSTYKEEKVMVTAARF